jgi:hypothetical protein
MEGLNNNKNTLVYDGSLHPECKGIIYSSERPCHFSVGVDHRVRLHHNSHGGAEHKGLEQDIRLTSTS